MHFTYAFSIRYGFQFKKEKKKKTKEFERWFNGKYFIGYDFQIKQNKEKSFLIFKKKSISEKRVLNKSCKVWEKSSLKNKVFFYFHFIVEQIKS